VDHPYPGGVIRLHPFLAEIIAGQPEPHEHTALRWVDSNTAATLEWAPADLPVLAELWSRPAPAPNRNS
jgi:8-oxo-dGTP diphosphatase